MGVLDLIRERRAIGGYLARLGPALVERYGREPHYSIGQILTTLRLRALDARYLDRACALFASRNDFVEWMAQQAQGGTSDDDAIVETFRVARVKSAPRVSKQELRALYASLRESVAARFNRGSLAFIPEAPRDPEHWDNGSNDAAVGKYGQGAL
jgi:hypothetical protein